MSDYEFDIRQDERRTLIQARKIARIKRKELRRIQIRERIKIATQVMSGLFIAILGITGTFATKDFMPLVLLFPLSILLVFKRARG